MCRKEVAISLGVLDLDETHRAVGFREKPVLSFSCSMGVYAVSPGLLHLIPARGVFGFDDLMKACLAQDIAVRAYPFDGLWLDIGRPEDYAEAAKMFEEYRSLLLPRPAPARHPIERQQIERVPEDLAYRLGVV